jgi:hypothetical protein
MAVLSDSAWKTMQEALAAPFAPESVSWRVQGQAKPGQRVQVLAYLDARDIQDRLDDAVGAGNWSFDWQPVITNEKGLLVAKGTLTIHGVSKSDVGDASTFEGTKGTISDVLKRCAVQWGVGRYLYHVEKVWIRLNDRGEIGPREEDQLRAVLEGKPLPAEAPRPAPAPTPARPQPPAQQDGEQPANEGQKQSLQKLYIALGEVAPPMESFTFASAGATIRELSRRWNNNKRRSA